MKKLWCKVSIYAYAIVLEYQYVFIQIVRCEEDMARITVLIDDELDRRVRTEISRSGGKKGDLAKTVEEALLQWVMKREKASATKKKGEE
jgi:hypothetical protein